MIRVCFDIVCLVIVNDCRPFFQLYSILLSRQMFVHTYSIYLLSYPLSQLYAPDLFYTCGLPCAGQSHFRCELVR